MTQKLALRRKLSAVGLVLCAVMILGSVRPAAAQANPVTITIEPGYQNFFRSDRLLPIRVTVSNSGPDVSGDLRTESTTQGGSTYSTHLELPNGSTKQVFLYTSLAYFAQDVKIDLVNDSGLIASTSAKVQWANAAELLYAVVTDPSQSSRLKVDFKLTKNTPTHRIDWRIENIPGSADALRALDVIIFDNVDTGTLTADQRQALDDWTLSGGHLIVTGGPNWQKTQAGLVNLLPLQPNGTTTLASISSLASFAGWPNDQLSVASGNPIIVAQGTLTPDAQVLAAEGSVPILVRHPYGSGNVDYLAVDPNLQPYPSWVHTDNFWFSVFSTVDVRPSWDNGVVQFDRAEVLANYIKGLRLPDVAQLCGFLAVYIILIGPLNYLILKRLGRRELAWITIPLLIVGYSAIAYVTGFSLRGTMPTLNRVAIVQVWPGQESARVDGIIGVLSPRRASYDVSIANGLMLRPINGTTGSGITSSPLDADIQEQPGTTLDYIARSVSVNAGLVASFTTSGFIKAAPMQGSATVSLVSDSSNAANTSGQVTANIKNTTGLRLDDAVLLVPGGAENLGTLQPGEQRTVNVPFTSNSSGSPVWAGNGLVNASGYYGGYYYQPPGSTNNNCGYVNPTVADLMGNNCAYSFYGFYGYYGYGNTSNPQQQELQRRQILLDSLIQDSDRNGERGSHVYLAGWTSSSPLDMSLGDATFNTEDTTLYIYQLPTTFSAADANNIVEVKGGLTSWTLTPDSGRTDVTPYNLSLQPGDDAVFRYLPLVPLKDVQQLHLTMAMPNNTYAQVDVSLWDWMSGQWVDVTTLTSNGRLGYDNAIPAAQPYVGPGGAVQVQIKANSSAGLNSSANAATEVDVTLYGHLNSAQ